MGTQALTGVFPKPGESVTSVPLELVWCSDCTLLQLSSSCDPNEMYGDNYGYRSGLNKSMVTHLENKARSLEVGLSAGDVVIDIGSNDGTLLASYQTEGLTKIGIDPTGEKFAEFYPEDVELMPEFFAADAVNDLNLDSVKAKVVTSVAMFYDLENPVEFAKDVASILHEDGVWHLEQSYMPSMLRSTSYDTICHEHLEYYSLASIQEVLTQVGLSVVDVRFNQINGGSFALDVMHNTHKRNPLVGWFAGKEEHLHFDTVRPFRDFEERVFQHRQDLQDLIGTLRDLGKTVMGYGASTKGNVLLQFCGFTPEDIPAIGEVNEDKFGRVTPGTNIPIVSEDEVREADYLLVLPWHFREAIIEREHEFLDRGGKLIFPLPEIEIFSR